MRKSWSGFKCLLHGDQKRSTSTMWCPRKRRCQFIKDLSHSPTFLAFSTSTLYLVFGSQISENDLLIAPRPTCMLPHTILLCPWAMALFTQRTDLPASVNSLWKTPLQTQSRCVCLSALLGPSRANGGDNQIEVVHVVCKLCTSPLLYLEDQDEDSAPPWVTGKEQQTNHATALRTSAWEWHVACCTCSNYSVKQQTKTNKQTKKTLAFPVSMKLKVQWGVHEEISMINGTQSHCLVRFGGWRITSLWGRND